MLAVSFRSSSAKNWKRNLQKPPKPPLLWLLQRPWVKPLIYGTAGAASLLVWRSSTAITFGSSSTSMKTAALALYGCGLLLDMAWSPILYGAKLVGAAAVDRAVASVALGAALPVFGISNPIAAALLLPLFAWECCGAYWTYCLWQLNRHHIRETKRRGRDNHGYNAPLGEE